MNAIIGTAGATMAARESRLAHNETRVLFALAAFGFIGSMLFRSPRVLTAPRFWAEEGFVYYQFMQHSSWWDGLTFVFRGNYQLLTNVACLIAAHCPDRLAAFPSTYLSAALDIYCCFLLAEMLRSHGCALVTVVAAIIMFSLQHAGYEVFLNATNVMWVCSVSSLFIALGDERKPATPRAWIAYGSVAVFGLTGITSVALLPIFVCQALRKHSRYRYILLIVLGCAAAVQAAVILDQGITSGRALQLTFRSVVPIVLQTEFASLLPSELLDAVGARIVRYDEVAIGMAVQIGLVGLAALALACGAASRTASRIDCLVIAAALVWISTFNVFGGLGDATSFHSGWDGGRYFFLGNTCFLILICLSRDGGNAFQRRAALCVMTLVISNSVVQMFGTPWIRIFIAGPSISSQVRACGEERPCRISYPPHGPGAEFMMDHRPPQDP